MSDRIICVIIRLNSWDEFENFGDINQMQTLTNLELIAIHEKSIREADNSSDVSD